MERIRADPSCPCHPYFKLALREIAYDGGVFVELSRHNPNAVETAQRGLAFLQGL